MNIRMPTQEKSTPPSSKEKMLSFSLAGQLEKRAAILWKLCDIVWGYFRDCLYVKIRIDFNSVGMRRYSHPFPSVHATSGNGSSVPGFSKKTRGMVVNSNIGDIPMKKQP